jgi:hypothetical protein
MIRRFLLLAFLLLAATACRETPAEPTATLLPEPTAVAEPALPEVQPTDEPTAIPAAEPTPLPTPEPTATATAVPEATPTPTPIPPTATATPTATAVPAAETISPGESYAGELANGGSQLFSFGGRQFQPLLFFAEAGADLNLSLAVYQADTAFDPATAVPLANVKFSDAGRPEIMVFSPNTTANYFLLVQAEAGSGSFTLHTFDAQPGDRSTLAAGSANEYTAVSNGARPVVILANPVGQADLIIRVTGADGVLIGEADFGGPGSAEAFFLLPLQTTTYTITISEATGAAAAYDQLIVPLD